MNSQREAFEKYWLKVTCGTDPAVWDEEEDEYEDDDHQLAFQHFRFGWQSATEQGDSVTVKYDLSQAKTESAIRQKLIDLGWVPPGKDLGGLSDGKVIAPIEPTEDMVYASNPDQTPSEAREAHKIIKAALALLATQQPPEQE